MATNVGFSYQRAEEEYRSASTSEEKLKCLQKMLREVPKHKSSEALQKQIKERIAKLKGFMDKQKKASKGGYSLAVKKEGSAQIVLIGMTNSGKSTLLHELTGARVEIADYKFTTKKPEIGIFDYKGVKLQIVEIPAIVKNFDSNNDGKLSFAEFLRAIRGNLNERRRNMVHMAYKVLDKTGDGLVTIADIE